MSKLKVDSMSVLMQSSCLVLENFMEDNFFFLQRSSN